MKTLVISMLALICLGSFVGCDRTVEEKTSRVQKNGTEVEKSHKVTEDREGNRTEVDKTQVDKNR